MNLHLEAVSSALFDLLQRLMREDALVTFALGGGTSLALRFGHRESVDLDLFTQAPFDSLRLADVLKQSHGMVESGTAENSVSGVIDGIKVDILAHRYPLVAEVVVVGEIRMLSLEDIAAMKLNAIANRGSKKDFWDYAKLLSRFSREEMLGFYSEKYPRDSLWNVGKSLAYFHDAENQPDPRDLRGQSWAAVKKIIGDHNRL